MDSSFGYECFDVFEILPGGTPMHPMKSLPTVTGHYICKSAKSADLNDSAMIREFCERKGLILLNGICFGSSVAEDASGQRYVLIPRKKNHLRWVEYSLIPKNQKLDPITPEPLSGFENPAGSEDLAELIIYCG